MLDQLTREDFEGLAAGALTVELPGGRIALSVVELHDLPPVSPRPRPFAVLLEGPGSPFMPQGIYPLQHPRRGSLALFLVPIARDSGSARYEVTFN